MVANVERVYGVDYDEFNKDHKRWLVSDKTDVRKIDSVYRNRDAGEARRGLKKLEKWWDEDDETLKEVMKDADAEAYSSPTIDGQITGNLTVATMV